MSIVATLFAAPAVALAGMSSSVAPTLAGAAVALFCLVGLGSMPAIAIALIAPAHIRARLIATQFFMFHVIGSGCAPVLVATFSGRVFAGEAALGNAIALLAAMSGPLAIALLLLPWKPFSRASLGSTAQGPAKSSYRPSTRTV